jgi:hypothetical protein
MLKELFGNLATCQPPPLPPTACTSAAGPRTPTTSPASPRGRCGPRSRGTSGRPGANLMNLYYVDTHSLEYQQTYELI